MQMHIFSGVLLVKKKVLALIRWVSHNHFATGFENLLIHENLR